MDRLEAKITAVIISFLLPFVFLLLPYKLYPWICGKGEKGERIVSYLLCFGGGIFLGTFLLHLGPEVRYIVNKTLLAPNQIQYPVADLIIGCGFFFVLYLEKIVIGINDKRLLRKEKKLEESCLIFRGTKGRVCPNCREGKTCLGLVNSDASDRDSVKSSETVSTEPDREKTALKCNGFVDDERIEDNEKERESERPKSGDSEEGNHSIRSLILAVALSFHHIYEGLALGLQYSIEQILTLLLAIMCHETIISFSLGLQFVKSRFSGKAIFFGSLFYSLVLPVGVALGIALSETKTGDAGLEITNGIVQAFSTGTFIYVTFFEILQHEIGPHDAGLVRVTGAALGFVVMGLLALLDLYPPSPDSTGSGPVVHAH